VRAPQQASKDMGLQDGGGIIVFIAAFFVVPQIMHYMPDFDPLLVIVGLFVVLGVLQHLGIISANAGQAGEFGQEERRGNRAGHGRGSDAAAQEEESRAPTLPELLSEAERCFKQNNYARAQELASKATDLDPENAQAWELLATAQKWEGKREDALATVKKAQDIYEVQSEGLTTLARELEQAESPADMAAECEVKGEEFLSKRMYDLASECYTKAIDALEAGGEADSDKELRLRLRRRRADCAQQLQDWGVCRRDATVVLEANPNDPAALLQRAAANEALEKFSAALEDARKLRSIDPKSTAANRIIHNCQQALRS